MNTFQVSTIVLLLVSALTFEASAQAPKKKSSSKRGSTQTAKKAPADTVKTVAVTVPTVKRDSTVNAAPVRHTTETFDPYPPRTNMVTANLLRYTTFFNLMYFRTLNSQFVIGGGLQLPSFRDYSGMGLYGELRWYAFNHAPYELYVAPNLSFNLLQYFNDKMTMTSLGALVGWQIFPWQNLTLSAGLGIEFYFGAHDVVAPSGNAGGSYTGSTPTLRVEAGYGW